MISKQTLMIATSAALYFKSGLKLNNQAEQKQQQPNYPYFRYASKYSPKFEKRFKNGEDSHVISDDQKLIMVADGVGGWGDLDVDPGLFSKYLTSTVN